MGYGFFAFLSRMKYINRWGLMRSTVNENIAEHSLSVAFIAHSLAVIENKHFGGDYDADKAGMLGAFHESSEVITGDLPTPIKYFNTEIRDAYKKIEKNANSRLLETLPEDLRPFYAPLLDSSAKEYRLVKYADKLNAYIKCLEELSYNNNEFKTALKTIEDELKGYNSQSVNYFIKNFVDAYTLTLDELTQK